MIPSRSPTDVTFSGTFDGTSLKGSINVVRLALTLDFTGVRSAPTGSRAVNFGGAQ